MDIKVGIEMWMDVEAVGRAAFLGKIFRNAIPFELDTTLADCNELFDDDIDIAAKDEANVDLSSGFVFGKAMAGCSDIVKSWRRPTNFLANSSATEALLAAQG